MTYDEYIAFVGEQLGWAPDEVHRRRFRALEGLRVIALTESLCVTSQVCSRGKRDWSATVRAEGCKTGVWTRMCGLRSWKRRTGCCGSG